MTRFLSLRKLTWKDILKSKVAFPAQRVHTHSAEIAKHVLHNGFCSRLPRHYRYYFLDK